MSDTNGPSESAIGKWTARPTMYRGVRMRSRTEAKVAQLLDQAGMEWTYEGDAFAGTTGQYLPDFVVGDLGDHPLIIEVKPLSEMRAAALNKMAVVWETDPTAALLVIATDDPFFSGVELRDGEPMPFCWGLCRCSCGHVSVVSPGWSSDDTPVCPECEQEPPPGSMAFSDGDFTAKQFTDGLYSMSTLLYVELALTPGPLKALIAAGEKPEGA